MKDFQEFFQESIEEAKKIYQDNFTHDREETILKIASSIFLGKIIRDAIVECRIDRILEELRKK
jgi:hypothetical protein